MKIKLNNPLQIIDYPLNKLIDLRQQVREAYSILHHGEFLPTSKNRHNNYYHELKISILDICKESISEGTLVKFFHEDTKRKYQIIKIRTLEYYAQHVFKSVSMDFEHSNSKENLISKNLNYESCPKSWLATTNHSTPQWASYLPIPLNFGLFRSFTCNLSTQSQYYRFGFKLLRLNGKLFGDGSIQSMDNNFVIHIGKNFFSDDIFITTYNNGIRFRPDLITTHKSSKNTFKVELVIDPESFLLLKLDETEVFRKLINREIREQLYLLAWGDGNEFEININEIEIRVENE